MNQRERPSSFPVLPVSPELSVVGNCPECGYPIYGRLVVPEGEFPVAVNSCSCSRNKGFVGEYK